MSTEEVPGTVDAPQRPAGASDAPQTTTAPPMGAAGEATTELDLRGYELGERLGSGGMGDVYRAADPALGRDLAVKIMKAELQGSAAAEQRLVREARVTGSLQHPGIVPIHNLGRLADGRLHYTMRLMRGQTLADILKEQAGKPEHWSALLAIFEKVCQAVAYAHSKGVIHRDLKPANVMVGRFGEVQVMDWGLAKVLTPGEGESVSTPKEDQEFGTRIYTEAVESSQEQTRLGREMGTPSYMPPEQALGEWDTVDERADVFALGAILCEILTGRPPYRGRDREEVLRKAKRGDVAEAMAQLDNCGAEAALLALCRDCLTPALENRLEGAEQVAQRVAAYQTAVQERLRQAELERTAAVVKSREERKKRRWIGAAAVLLLAGATASSWQAMRATKAEGQARENEERALNAAQAERTAKDEAEQAAEKERQANDLSQKRQRQIEKANEVLASIFSDLDPRAEEKGGPNLRQQLSQHLERAVKQLDEAAVDDPLTVAGLQSTLGISLIELGQAPLALAVLEKAVKTREAKLGDDHLDTLTSRNNLAYAYQSVGRMADAIRLHEQTLKQREAKLGDDHPDTPTSMANLGMSYRFAGRLSEAIPLLETALQRGRQHAGGLPAPLAWVPDALAQTYEQAGQFSKAESIYRDALEQTKQKFGSDHSRTAGVLVVLGKNLLKQKKCADAEPLLRQCLTIRDRQQPDDWATFNTRSALGDALLGQKKYAEAEPLLLQGYEGVKQRQDKISPLIRPARLSEALERLARLYEAAGQKDKAAAWQKKLEEAKAVPKTTKP